MQVAVGLKQNSSSCATILWAQYGRFHLALITLIYPVHHPQLDQSEVQHIFRSHEQISFIFPASIVF